MFYAVFFFNDTATTEIYTLSLHDALPIFLSRGGVGAERSPRVTPSPPRPGTRWVAGRGVRDRKSTRLNSSHANISYAVFCLKKKKKIPRQCCSMTSHTTMNAPPMYAMK